mmetsp:Transcript_110065/g.194963  ORF Transcript_110065/g.194963 Transcript_110065/m.194963 type:complete len:353 (+) Transcript_110065:57-1115(+)
MNTLLNKFRNVIPDGQLDKRLFSEVVQTLDPNFWSDEKIDSLLTTLPDTISIETLAGFLYEKSSMAEAPKKAGRFFVGANWKCSINNAEGADALVAKLNDAWKNGGSLLSDVEVCVFPPYVFLDRVRAQLRSGTASVGSQNAWDAAPGFSCTGVVTAEMLRSTGCQWVLLGHSDRRNVLGETDSLIADKVSKCLEAGLSVNLTIGETREVRESVGSDGATKVLLGQLEAAAAGIPNDAWGRIAVAYEPVWAIGEGASPCSPEETQRILAALREWIRDRAGATAAADCRLLYTGSVNEANAAEYAKLPEVDGFIVGRAGLDVGKLVSICSTLASCKKVKVDPGDQVADQAIGG